MEFAFMLPSNISDFGINNVVGAAPANGAMALFTRYIYDL
jgi:hypothetical protein